jgi:hypothetical protein
MVPLLQRRRAMEEKMQKAKAKFERQRKRDEDRANGMDVPSSEDEDEATVEAKASADKGQPKDTKEEKAVDAIERKRSLQYVAMSSCGRTARDAHQPMGIC